MVPDQEKLKIRLTFKHSMLYSYWDTQNKLQNIHGIKDIKSFDRNKCNFIKNDSK